MSAERYQAAIRSAVRGLWSGAIDYGQYLDVMGLAIDRFLPMAWADGAKECGIQPAEYTPQERRALQEATAQEYLYVVGLGDAIQAGSRANGGKLTPLYQRVDLWVKRYRDIKNRAMEMACQDQKLKWIMNPAKENCCSCIQLADKVKRASFWREAGVRPQHPSLHCMQSAGGPSVCGCQFVVTDERLSPGPLPNWRC